MAINKKLIHFDSKAAFTSNANNAQGIKTTNLVTTPDSNGNVGNIPYRSIVFIKDSGEIWTHGKYYSNSLPHNPSYLTNANTLNSGEWPSAKFISYISNSSSPYGNYPTSAGSALRMIRSTGSDNYTQSVWELYASLTENELWFRNSVGGETWATWYKIIHQGNLSLLNNNFLPLSGGTLTGALTVKSSISLITKSDNSLTEPNQDLSITSFGMKSDSDTIKSWKFYSYQGTDDSPAGIGYMPIVFGSAYPTGGGLFFTGSKSYSGTTYDNYWGINTNNPQYTLDVNGTIGANNFYASGNVYANSNKKVATEEWVGSRGYLTSHQSLSEWNTHLSSAGNICGIRSANNYLIGENNISAATDANVSISTHYSGAYFISDINNSAVETQNYPTLYGSALRMYRSNSSTSSSADTTLQIVWELYSSESDEIWMRSSHCNHRDASNIQFNRGNWSKILSVFDNSITTIDSSWLNNNTGKFYLGNTNPTKNTRLNYNGNLYATTFHGSLDGTATYASTANKLSNTSAIGSSTEPVYFTANGVPSKINQLKLSFSDTTSLEISASNSNGRVGIYVSQGRGLYDFTKGSWIIHRTQNSQNTYISDWASIGDNANPIYINSNGRAAATNYTFTATTPSSSSTDATVPTSKAVWSAVNAGFIANDAMVFKGTFGSNNTLLNGNKNANPSQAYQAGWTYRINANGYINTSGVFTTSSTNSWQRVEIGDLLIAISDSGSSQTAVNTGHWTIVQTNIVTQDYLTTSNYTDYTYGKSNLYTKTESDNRYVNVTGDQTITGQKTFNSAVIFNSEIQLMTRTDSSLDDPNQDLTISSFWYRNIRDSQDNQLPDQYENHDVKAWHIYSYQSESSSPAGVGSFPMTFGCAYPNDGALSFTGNKDYSGTTYNNYWGINIDNPQYRLHVNGTFGANTIYENGTSLSEKYFPLSAGNSKKLTGDLWLTTDTSGESRAIFFERAYSGNYDYKIQIDSSGDFGIYCNKNTNTWTNYLTIGHQGGTDDLKYAGYTVYHSGNLPAYPAANVTTSMVLASSEAGTSNISSVTNNPYINLLEGGSVSKSIRISGSGGTSVQGLANSKTITISSTSPTSCYWANIQITSSAAYNKAPEFSSITIGNGTTSSGTKKCQQIYDSTNQCLKFVFV